MSTEKVLEGKWDDNVSWEFYLTDQLPSPALCTAVFCLAIVEASDQIVLARNKRGWGMLGGHKEPGETLEDTLIREAFEEGGFRVSKHRPFGYQKIMSELPVANDHHGGTYPPVTFMPHFLAVTSKPLERSARMGTEIIESRAFDQAEIDGLHVVSEAIVYLGLEQYQAVKANWK